MKLRLLTISVKINENPAAAKNLTDSCTAAAKLLETQFGINYTVFHIGGGKSGYHLFAIDVDKHQADMTHNIMKISAYSEGALSGILWAFGHTS